jgi:Holliday junction resolvase
MSGAKHRRKGDRTERELVDAHRTLGIHAERYPLSGASRFRGSGHDLDVYLFGREQAPLVAEVKARKSGDGFVQLERWLGDFDALFLRRNHAEPLVVIPWRLWARIIETMQPRQPAKPAICEGCGASRADPPSKLCPGCQAYREHQA